MKHKTVIINKITAEDGFWLTNGQGACSKEVFIGTNDDIEKWYEITETEYQEILKKQEERL